jgi:hypothetical protein
MDENDDDDDDDDDEDDDDDADITTHNIFRLKLHNVKVDKDLNTWRETPANTLAKQYTCFHAGQLAILPIFWDFTLHAIIGG